MDDSTIRGGWDRSEIESFLAEYRGPLRLAVSTDSGFPLICSLWFQWNGEKLVCATTRKARVVELIEANPRCGFEVAPNEPPYFGVRGRAEARITEEGANQLLESLVSRYLGTTEGRFARWLLNREEEEVVIELDVRWITSWDYRDRMNR